MVSQQSVCKALCTTSSIFAHLPQRVTKNSCSFWTRQKCVNAWSFALSSWQTFKDVVTSLTPTGFPCHLSSFKDWGYDDCYRDEDAQPSHFFFFFFLEDCREHEKVGQPIHIGDTRILVSPTKKWHNHPCVTWRQVSNAYPGDTTIPCVTCSGNPLIPYAPMTKHSVGDTRNCCVTRLSVWHLTSGDTRMVESLFCWWHKGSCVTYVNWLFNSPFQLFFFHNCFTSVC